MEVIRKDLMDASEKIMYVLIIIKAVHFCSSWWNAAKSVSNGHGWSRFTLTKIQAGTNDEEQQCIRKKKGIRCCKDLSPMIAAHEHLSWYCLT